MAFWKPIPGETPIEDVSGLKIKGVHTRTELNIFEAANINRAVVKYLARRPSRRSARFDFSWALRLHKEMFGDVWKWAGQLRTNNKNIGIPWQQVETSLFSLFADLTYWERNETYDLLDQIVFLHHRAVHIHPFENGNGRWSRMLANIWLKLHDHRVTEWPEATVGEHSIIRTEYLAAIRQADQGEYGPLRALHLRFTQFP